jgi:hypothetical protein
MKTLDECLEILTRTREVLSFITVATAAITMDRFFVFDQSLRGTSRAAYNKPSRADFSAVRHSQ